LDEILRYFLMFFESTGPPEEKSVWKVGETFSRLVGNEFILDEKVEGQNQVDLEPGLFNRLGYDIFKKLEEEIGKKYGILVKSAKGRIYHGERYGQHKGHGD